MIDKDVVEKLKSVDGDIGLYIKFLDSEDKMIDFKSDKQFWAACVIKISVVCELYRQVKERIIDLNKRIKIKEDSVVKGTGVIHLLQEREYSIKDLVTLMMTISDNTATNELIDLISFEKVNEFIQTYGLKNTTLKHKMMIVAGRGPNLTTAKDVGILLEKLYNKELNGSEEILDLMNECKERERICRYIPGSVKVSHKDGSLNDGVHDVGIIFSKNPFIFVFLSDDLKDKEETKQILSEIAKMCFDYSND